MPLLTFNPCKNGNFFGSFHFCLSSCRHSVDSLSGSASRGKRSRRLQKNPCGNVPIRMGRLLRGEGMPLLTFNPCKNGNFFGSFHFCLSSCRHSVDSLSGSASRGKRSRRLFYTRHRGGRSCLHPTGLFRSFLAAGLLGHLQKAQDLRIAGGSGGVKDHTLAEIMTEGLRKALAGFFHLRLIPFLTDTGARRSDLDFRGRYDAFLGTGLVFGSKWCILVEAVLYALHKKCQQKLCTTSKGKGGFRRSVRVTEFGRGISPEGQTGSRIPDLALKKGRFVHFMLPSKTAGQERRRGGGEGGAPRES